MTDTYSYVPNGTGGDTALLDSVSLGSGGARDYSFGPAGHLDAVSSPGNQVFFTHDATGQLSRLERPSAGASTNLLFDGRGYLSLSTGELPPALLVQHGEAPEDAAADLVTRGTPGTPLFADGFEDGTVCAWTTTAGTVTPPPTACPKPQLLTAAATYSSAGVLHHLHTDSPSGGERELFYLYFQGRPVAQLERVGDTDTYHWIATDHLGTPIGFVERNSQTTFLRWHGGFEPFGADFSGASTAGVPLRLPGQWTDASWEQSSLGAEVYYNVHRWYEAGTGRYERADPLGLGGGINSIIYSWSRPTGFVDPLGLQTRQDGYIPDSDDIAQQIQRGCARQAFYRNYRDMVRANWKLSDKYFHCKANCEAIHCGDHGFEMACEMSDLREFADQVFKGDPPAASAADQAANAHGREQARNSPTTSCQIVCSQFRPKGLPSQY